MALKKSAEKSPKTVVTRTAAEGEPEAAAPLKVTRRRAPAGVSSADAAPVAARPARPKSAARKVAAAVATESVPAIAATPSRQVTDEHIRVRAYFLALESQGRGGSLDYWLRAERELRTGAASGD